MMPDTIKLTTGLLSYALGVAAVSLLSELPALEVVISLAVCSACLIVFACWWAPVFFPLMALCLGGTVGMGYGHWVKSQVLPGLYESKVLILSGRVQGLPAKGLQTTRFLFDVAPVKKGEHHPLHRLRLSWFSAPSVGEGQMWQLKVKLFRPHGFASPGTFDVEAWAAREGIQAMGYVLSGERVAESEGRHIRQMLEQWLDAKAAPRTAGLLKALLVGDKSGVSPEQWVVLNQTGTTHLMVISGLHIGLLALLGYWLARGIGWFGCWPLLRWPMPCIAGAFSLLLSVCYAVLAGFGVPVQRAVVMTVVALTGPLCGVRPASGTLLVVALAVVLTLDPLAVTSAGFWYSFMAVSALIFGASGWVGKGTHYERWLRPQWLVFCVLAPLLLFNGQPVSLLSPWVNLVAIPLVGLLVVPLLLLAALFSVISAPLSGGLLWLLDHILSGLLYGLTSVSEMAHSMPVIPQPGIIAVVFALAGSAVLVLPLPWRLKIASPLLFLPWWCPPSQAPDFGRACINMLDVGQGLSVVVRTQHHTLVYDTGDYFSPSLNAADSVIIPYLRTAGVEKLDRIIISHGDKDHSGGLVPLLKQYPCTNIVSGTALPYYTRPVDRCKAGEQWVWDGVSFEVLSAGGKWKRGNDCSCVLKITAGNDSILLTGDISHRVEKKLVAMNKDLKATVLLASHHGSRYSNTDVFLNAVRPTDVVFSTGYQNRFGHPSKQALVRVEKIGAVSWNTAISGTVSVELGSVTGKMSGYRQKHRRYWWQG